MCHPIVTPQLHLSPMICQIWSNGTMTALLNSVKERQSQLLFHLNMTEIYPSTPLPPPVFTNSHELDVSSPFSQLGLSVSSTLTGKPYIHSIAKHASQKLGFLFRARGFFSPSQLLTIYKSKIRPSLEYCSHVWGGAFKSTLQPFEKVQSNSSHSCRQ